MTTIRTCKHVMPDGHLCQSPAMRHQSYCYFHNEHRKKAARMHSKSCPYFPHIPINTPDNPECPMVLASRLLATVAHFLIAAQRHSVAPNAETTDTPTHPN